MAPSSVAPVAVAVVAAVRIGAAIGVVAVVVAAVAVAAVGVVPVAAAVERVEGGAVALLEPGPIAVFVLVARAIRGLVALVGVAERAVPRGFALPAARACIGTKAWSAKAPNKPYPPKRSMSRRAGKRSLIRFCMSAPSS